MMMYCVIWLCYIILFHIIFCHIISYYIILNHMLYIIFCISYFHIILYIILFYHIITYHIFLYIFWYYIILYYITPCCLILNHFKYIISNYYQIILMIFFDHIVSYEIFFISYHAILDISVFPHVQFTMLQIPTCTENMLLMLPGIYVHVIVEILVISRGLGFCGGSLAIALPGQWQYIAGLVMEWIGFADTKFTWWLIRRNLMVVKKQLVTIGLKKLGFPTSSLASSILHWKKSMGSLVQPYNIVTKWCCSRGGWMAVGWNISSIGNHTTGCETIRVCITWCQDSTSCHEDCLAPSRRWHFSRKYPSSKKMQQSFHHVL